jgi:methylmalonyl-CoA mutase cobalamin-binding domain/chain
MTAGKIIQRLRESIIDLDEDKVRENTKKVINSNLEVKEVIEKGIMGAVQVIGDRFESGEYFLVDLFIAEDIIGETVDNLVSQLSEGAKIEKIGRVAIATVYGDIHDIGKKLVIQLLKLHNFEVQDFGKDVPSLQIVNRAVEMEADMIFLSSLMSTTRPSQKEVIDMLKEFGMRDKFKVYVGGGSTNQEWAEEIEADGWGETAWDGVKLAIEQVGVEE